MPNPRLHTNDTPPRLEHLHKRLNDHILVVLGHLGGGFKGVLLLRELLDLAADGDEDLGLFAVTNDVLDVLLLRVLCGRWVLGG